MTDILPVLKDLLANRREEVCGWFDEKFSTTQPFFYNSVDIRHSGFKIAPVDTNLFPGGFNNLSMHERDLAATKATRYFETYFGDVSSVLLIAEDHTRNLYYLENIAVLKNILEAAGKKVWVSSIAASQDKEALHLQSQSGQKLSYLPIIRHGDEVRMQDGGVPDMVLINNDMTTGAPELLKDIRQPIIPPLGFGWYRRRKTSHFDTYNDLVKDFCRTFSIDSWLLSTYFHRCGVVDFREKSGLECVAIGVDKTLHRIQQKYDEYGIKQKPYVFIKSDKGTYGMGIMTASSGQEVLEIGKKIRNKMTSIKGGAENSAVIIQEGVPTIDVVDGHPAEPMIYLIGAEPVGCMYRLNTRKDNLGNLNASGMQFASMSKDADEPCSAVGLIAKLASYASAWECYAEMYSI